MKDSYDAVSEKVNDEIEKLNDDATFANLEEIDKKLKLPRGTSFETSGLSDYFQFYLDT